MSDVLHQNGKFDPIHGAHAIEQVFFIVQIERPLDDAEFSKVRQTALQFKIDDELPAITELQGFTISIGSGSPTPTQNGFMLFRTGTDGTVEKELRIERNSVMFRTLRYSRWKDVWAEAKKYFGPIVPLFAHNNKITGISLNTIDKFVWSGTPSQYNASYLLRSGSNYLCPHIFQVNDLWHSHTGSFIRVNDKTKRLLNINADSLDEKQFNGARRVIVIATVLTDFLNQLDYEPFNVTSEDVMEKVETQLQELHSFGNDVFRNILNDEMAKRIALVKL
jgi:uncharacterized protein (TIGR04255 family)